MVEVESVFLVMRWFFGFYSGLRSILRCVKYFLEKGMDNKVKR